MMEAPKTIKLAKERIEFCTTWLSGMVVQKYISPDVQKKIPEFIQTKNDLTMLLDKLNGELSDKFFFRKPAFEYAKKVIPELIEQCERESRSIAETIKNTTDKELVLKLDKMFRSSMDYATEIGECLDELNALDNA